MKHPVIQGTVSFERDGLACTGQNGCGKSPVVARDSEGFHFCERDLRIALDGLNPDLSEIPKGFYIELWGDTSHE